LFKAWTRPKILAVPPAAEFFSSRTLRSRRRAAREPDPRPQIGARPDAGVGLQAGHDIVDPGARGFANIRQVVGEHDARRQKGVDPVFDDLGAFQAHGQDIRREKGEKVPAPLASPAVGRAQDDPSRIEIAAQGVAEPEILRGIGELERRPASLEASPKFPRETGRRLGADDEDGAVFRDRPMSSTAFSR
jgi:hypothetical protein